MTFRLAIIGTAGRGRDGARLTPDLWAALQADAAWRVGRLLRDRRLESRDLVLVSGGAAGADHLAIRLWRAGAAGGLELHLPARLDAHGYDRGDPTGRSMNHFHWRFGARSGCRSLAELAAAVRAGAAVRVAAGRAARNAAVAAEAQAVLAYTFGGAKTVTARPGDPEFADPAAAGVAEPGTADTWARAVDAAVKLHVPLAHVERP
jgi:hypothetical protein